jgi:hypothetical protein
VEAEEKQGLRGDRVKGKQQRKRLRKYMRRSSMRSKGSE